MLLAVVPGARQDNPVNEVLHAAWKSLRALGTKFQGPKIGQIHVNQNEVLAATYTRGAWNQAPIHHVVFTYQAVQQAYSGRKKMKYLKTNDKEADTYFNEWPVPMLQVSQMAKTTKAEHGQIFKDDLAEDEGDEDGAGAAVVTELGDKVVPFPHEMPAKLWQEFIHVWGIDVGVLLMPGGGLALLAFVLERKRAVGVMKKKAHKDFVMNNLKGAVKALGLAPDQRPPKPAALTAWETSRSLSAPPAGSPKALYGVPARVPTLTTPTAPPAGSGPGQSGGPGQAGGPEGGPGQAPGGPGLAAFGSAPLR